jgi:threonyl-tRNA synthetase
MVKVKFPDGSVKEYPDGTTPENIAEELEHEAEAVAAKVDGNIVDLYTPLEGEAEMDFVRKGDPEAAEVLRHTVSHIMAQAVKRLFPKAKVSIGPPIEDGFYYDFDHEPFSDEDLDNIKAEMDRIVAEDIPIRRSDIPREAALQEMAEKDEHYKVELINDLEDEIVSMYEQGDFKDLCRGPHMVSTGKVPADSYALTSTSGAYWRGDEHRKMLQRIYGTAYFDRAALDAHMERVLEAKKRDHRKLGKALDLYSVHNEAGAGLIHWHPKGSVIREEVEKFWKQEHIKRGYSIVHTPHIVKELVYEKSGHLRFYSDKMYAPINIDEVHYRVKPMNCPGHIMIYQTKKRSYRDLPIRYCELGTVYRREPSGTLHGMLRVRGFTQDDAHIFCTPEQLEDEIIGVLNLADFLLKIYGYSYKTYLSTRPEKRIGSDEIWEMSEASLRAALDKTETPYETDPAEGVFYGPKVDLKMFDALDREWQGPTIQVDFNFPDRFNVNYTGPDGRDHRVVMVHRTVLGSMERFVGGLIEQYAGNFPTWLAPVQVCVIPITDAQTEYARGIETALTKQDVRVELDGRNESVGYRIRSAATEKIPYVLVIGKREAAAGTVSVRRRGKGDLGPSALEDFTGKIVQEINEKRLE